MKTVLWVFVLGVFATALLAQPDPPDVEELVIEIPDVLVMVQAPPTPPAPPAPPAIPRSPVMIHASGSFLGIGVAEIESDRARELKLAEERGVEVTRVDADSPAAKAGLQKGDVVLEYQGQRVEGTEQFVRLVRETPPGRQVKLLISRNGATQTLTATIGSRRWSAVTVDPEWRRDMERMQEEMRGRLVLPDTPAPMMSWRSSMLGVEAESLSSQLAEFFGVKQGVLVRSVTKNSAAEKAGIKAGDVITQVDGKEVRSPSQVTSQIRSLRSKRTFPVTIVRNRQEMTLNVTMEEESGQRYRFEYRPRTRSINTKTYRL